MDLNTIRQDPNKAKKGVWIAYGDAMILIGRFGNKAFIEKFNSRVAPYKNMLETIPEETSERIMAEVIAETILLGWENIQINGETVEYSFDEAVSILSNPEYEPFRRWVMDQSNNLENFRLTQVETDLGN